MSKCLPFFKKRNETTSRSLCGANDNPVSSGEVARLRSPQSVSASSEVIFTFENGNVLTLKKQTMHPNREEADATSSKLLLPIVVVLGGSEG